MKQYLSIMLSATLMLGCVTTAFSEEEAEVLTVETPKTMMETIPLMQEEIEPLSVTHSGELVCGNLLTLTANRPITAVDSSKFTLAEETITDVSIIGNQVQITFSKNLPYGQSLELLLSDGALTDETSVSSLEQTIGFTVKPSVTAEQNTDLSAQKITFAMPIQPETLLATEIRVTGGASTFTPSAIVAEGDDKTFTLQFSHPLEYLTEYTVTIPQTVTDQTGTSVGGDVLFTAKASDVLLEHIRLSKAGGTSIFAPVTGSNITEVLLTPNRNASVVVKASLVRDGVIVKTNSMSLILQNGQTVSAKCGFWLKDTTRESIVWSVYENNLLISNVLVVGEE